MVGPSPVQPDLQLRYCLIRKHMTVKVCWADCSSDTWCCTTRQYTHTLVSFIPQHPVTLSLMTSEM